MGRFGKVLTAGVLAGTVGITSGAGQALARDEAPSAVPRVRMGSLSGPTTGPDGAAEYWLDVTASDRDGVISEITVSGRARGSTPSPSPTGRACSSRASPVRR